MPLPDQPGPAEILDRLAPELRALLGHAAVLAGNFDARLWLVGGVVRDALLGLATDRDIDLAVEGDVNQLAPGLASALGGTLLASHQAFGTATLQIGPLSLDLAQTRVEQYPRPAALPEVRPAPIADDLIRRDFSINAIALELRPAGAGTLLDPFGGQADLRAGLLRLLHPLSLRDDPTRLLRGLRLAARLNLRPEPASAELITTAIAGGYLSLLTAERVQNELCLALVEPRPDVCLAHADEWQLTPQLAPGLAYTPALAGRCARLASHAPPVPVERELLWLGLLVYDLDDAALSGILARYHLPSAPAALLRELGSLRALAVDVTNAATPSALDRLLHAFSPVAICVLHYAEPATAAATARYLRELRPHRAPLDGNDLRHLGVNPGPLLGRLLGELRAASLDGMVGGREEAVEWVRERLATANP